jgi:ABC-type Fe3+-hydroxamate transport system substrate-binding protein
MTGPQPPQDDLGHLVPLTTPQDDLGRPVPLTTPQDDLGHPVPLTRPARRVVSLVPSLTESVAVTRPGALVGATTWCTHPAGLDVARVRGTKNPDLAAIRALEPDLVLANQEENRRVDVERLRSAGIPVWVTVIRDLDEAVASLRRMFSRALGWREPPGLAQAERAWAQPVPGPRIRAAIPIWRDPWMVVGSGTFTGDLATRLGLDNVYAGHPGRYPRVDLPDLEARQPDLIVLPDEPYAFSATDGPEMFPARRVALVSGRDLTWYGPSLITARPALQSRLQAAVSS